MSVKSNDEPVTKKHKNDNDNQIDKTTIDRTNNLKDLFAKAQQHLNDTKVKLMVDNRNNNIVKIETVFQMLRTVIDQHEEILKKEVLAVEKQNEVPLEECLKSIQSKQDLLSCENEKFEKLISADHPNQLEQNEARFTTFLQKFTHELSVLKPTNTVEYCIDEIDGLGNTFNDILQHVCVTEFVPREKYGGQTECQGRCCIKCGKCRDWYYKGDRDTWSWIISRNEWNEEDRERWDTGNYKEFFKRRNGSTCIGHYGYFYDRNMQYHGPHIYFSCVKICKGCKFSVFYFNEECCGYGMRTEIKSDVYKFCQCSDNVKIIN